jgi:hypothetical protein
MADIKYADNGFEVEAFVTLAKRVWPREYDLAAAAVALTRTMNIGAWDGERLVGAVRILTDRAASPDYRSAYRFAVARSVCNWSAVRRGPYPGVSR